MMTNGPEATVGQVLEIPFSRPRNRKAVLEHKHYYDFRACLLSFLQKQEHNKEQHVKETTERLSEQPVQVQEPEPLEVVHA